MINYNLKSKKQLFSFNKINIVSLYFTFGLFTGIIGTILSIFIRLELSTPGSHYLLKNFQLYNINNY